MREGVAEGGNVAATQPTGVVRLPHFCLKHEHHDLLNLNNLVFRDILASCLMLSVHSRCLQVPVVGEVEEHVGQVQPEIDYEWEC